MPGPSQAHYAGQKSKPVKKPKPVKKGKRK